MDISAALSQFSIRKQILIGYIPVLLVLGFLAFTSYNNFKTFFQNFNSLSASTEENLMFLEIEKDIIKLQRNVIVYSYVGYRGILRKIEFLQKNLEEKFELMRPIAEKNPDISDRFHRMFNHYEDYKRSFEEAVNEKAKLKDLKTKKLGPLIKKSHLILGQIVQNVEASRDFESAYLVMKIERDFLQVDKKIRTFEITPDASLIKDANSLMVEMRNNVQILKSQISKNDDFGEISEFLYVLDEYQKIFREIIINNRVHLHLVNVVLAGKAAEIDKLSGELDDLVSGRSHALTAGISKNIASSQKNYLSLSVIAGSVGILCALFIAIGIAQPVNDMASTLSRLAKGQPNIIIPGQLRKDEVGEMAKAANEFKTMAEHLESQTAELEEFAYRTSHDLRSPLVSSIALLKHTEQSVEKGDSEKALKSLSLVQASLEKLEILVKDILALAQAKNSEEDIQNIEFEKIIDEAITKFTHMDNYGRVVIQKNLQYKEAFITQKSRITLIVENLISNAIKYQNSEEKSPFVNISTYEVGEKIVLSVADNGIGIPKDKKSKLFKMFNRFHPQTSFGSGLGLYMVKKSADILGGKVLYEDSECGSIFKLILPK